MANGDFINRQTPAGGGYQANYLMLDAQIATHSGVWIDVGWAKGKKTFHITQTTGTFTVQIFGSNGSSAGAKPADSTDDVQLGIDRSAASIMTIDDNVTYIKVKKSASDSVNGTTIVMKASSEV